MITKLKCKNCERYRGEYKPKCGCAMCWEIYRNRISDRISQFTIKYIERLMEKKFQ